MRETLPADDEAPAYYFKYIELVPRGDICAILETQWTEIPDWLSGISDEQSRFRHAPAAWSIREIVGHVNDTERVLAFRAFWFARRFDMLSTAGQTYAAEIRPQNVLAIFYDRGESEVVVEPRGLRNLRALASIIAGHTIHHVGLLKQRLPG